MKRLICALLAVGMLFSLSGCQEKGLPRPEFPLTEDVVNAALKSTNLPGTVSEEDTQFSAEEYATYRLRSEERMLSFFVFSSIHERERLLQVNYSSSPVSKGPTFAWEDWKQQLVFAALLFGGFADEEELYRTLSKQEMPEPEPLAEDRDIAQVIAESYKWDANLPAGYCKVRYELFNSSIESSSRGTRVEAQSTRMYITIYESEAHYQQVLQEGQERKEALLEDYGQASD